MFLGYTSRIKLKYYTRFALGMQAPPVMFSPFAE